MKIFDRLKNYYLAVCLALLILGAVADYAGSAISPYVSELTKMDVTGKVVHASFVSYPIRFYIFRISSGILYTACFSIFVALFIMHRIEEDQGRRNAKQLQEFQRAINVDVFDSLFRTVIPPEIFEAIKTAIIQGRVVRRNATWILDFWKGQGNEIELRQTIGFDLVNLSNLEVLEPTEVDVFVAGGSRQGLERATCTIGKDLIVSFDAADPKTQKGVEFKQQEPGRSAIEFAIKIPPGGTANLMTVFRNKYREFVQDEYFSKTALINADLTATFPEGYEFSLYSTLSAELRKVLVEKTRHIYKLKGGVLPGQGYVYYLNKTPVRDSSAGQAVAE